MILIRKFFTKLKRGSAYLVISVIRYRDGVIFEKVRYLCHKILLKRIGRNVKISTGCFLDYPENITLGNNISIHQFSIISGYGGVNIGNDVSIAHRCTIMSSSHDYKDEDMKIRDAKILAKSVNIGDDVWVGADVKILFGVDIGERVVLGAGSVINKDVPGNSIFAGVPAKKII